MNRKQRRDQLKLEKRMRNAGYSSANGDAVEWLSVSSHSKPKEKPPVPGIDIPPVDPNFSETVSRNQWHDCSELDAFVNTIKTLSQEDPFEADGQTLKPGCVDWTWARNTGCKYVNLRFDMRDGGFIMTNDRGERINLEQLKWQYQFRRESMHEQK